MQRSKTENGVVKSINFQLKEAVKEALFVLHLRTDGLTPTTTDIGDLGNLQKSDSRQLKPCKTPAK